MTYTLAQMMDEVQINLSGYTYQQDRSTYLTAAVTTTTSPSSSPLILSLASTQDLGKGVIEIDDELLWVDSVDRVANTATVSPYGRGYLGTTSEALHAFVKQRSIALSHLQQTDNSASATAGGEETLLLSLMKGWICHTH